MSGEEAFTAPAWVWRVAVALTVVTVELLRAFYFRKSSGPGLATAHQRNRGDTWLIGTLSLGWFASLVAFVAYPRALAFSDLGWPGAARLVGLLLAAAAVALLVWIHRSLGSNFSSVLRIKDDHQLVQAGPYRWVRHPMYAAFYVLSTGYFLLSANVLVGLTGLALMLALTFLRVPKEESDLMEKFGDRYRDYAERTGRLLPKL